MMAILRTVAVLALMPLMLQGCQTQPSVPRPVLQRTFDLILRSEITIDRPVREVWPHFLNMDVWMTDNRFQTIEGARGEAGEVRLVRPKEATPYAAYFIRAVRATPYVQYVLKVVPEKGHDYFGYADFSFTETDGKTHLIYDIYVELKVAEMSDAEYRRFSREQYEKGWLAVARNNQNLKSLVEARR
jgi:hypothetical protein